LANQSRVIFQIAFYSGFASVICASLLIFFTGKRLLRPLHMLVQGMTRLRGGKFDTRIRISTQDELAFLGQSFNEMAANIEALVKEVYERKLHEREAELTALQAQLNPHFLYNTLDTIYNEIILPDFK
jgi:two-component system sensor histidine kinase YesM